MAWAAKPAICPASSCSIRPRKAPAAGRATGAAAFCRPCTRACRSAARAIRCCFCRTRRHRRHGHSAIRSTRWPQLNAMRLETVGDPEIATRINSFELAYKMQTSAPELDGHLARSRTATLEMYGAEPGKPSYANNCLLARRLVERGVRFVQLFHEAWDHHGGLTKGLKDQTGLTDRASAALVKDLKQRGMLDDTLVIWGGEFGRTPMVQGGNDGRDHHPNAFTMWMAGGGVKPGITLGETDEFGFNAVDRPRPRARSARHDPAPAGLRPHAADLPLPRPRLPPDRRPRQRRREVAGVVGCSHTSPKRERGNFFCSRAWPNATRGTIESVADCTRVGDLDASKRRRTLAALRASLRVSLTSLDLAHRGRRESRLRGCLGH